MSTYLRRQKRFQSDPARKPAVKKPGLVLHSPASEHLHRRQKPGADLMPVVTANHPPPAVVGLNTKLGADEWISFGVGPVEQIAIRGGIVFLNDGSNQKATAKLDTPVPNLQHLLKFILHALPEAERQTLLEELNDGAETQPA